MGPAVAGLGSASFTSPSRTLNRCLCLLNPTPEKCIAREQMFSSNGGGGEGEGEGESGKCRRHAPGAMVTSVTQEGAADGINNNSVWMFSARVFMRARQHVPVSACTGVAVCILSQASRMRV